MDSVPREPEKLYYRVAPDRERAGEAGEIVGLCRAAHAGGPMVNCFLVTFERIVTFPIWDVDSYEILTEAEYRSLLPQPNQERKAS